MADFPSILPAVSISAYGYQEDDQNIGRTAMASGAVKVRALNSVSTHYFSVNWIMSPDELKIFEAWYVYKISNGLDWFSLLLKTGTGNNEHSVRFVGRPKIKEMSGNWGVSGTIETMNKNIISEHDLDYLLDPTSFPSILSATVNEAGNELTLVFSEAMTRGAGYLDSDFNLDEAMGGTDIGITYVSGDGTDSWEFTISKVIRKNEIVDLDYLGRTDGVEDSSGNDLESVGSFSVTNESEEAYSDIIFWDGFEGGITSTTYLSTENDYPPNHTGIIGNVAYVTLNTNTKRVGAKSIRVDGVSTDAKLTTALAEPIMAAQGRFGFWFNVQSAAAYQGILILSNSTISNMSLSIEFYNIPTVVSVTRLVAVGEFGEGDPAQLPATLPDTLVGSWNFLEVAWDVNGFGTKIVMNGQASSLTSYTPNRTWPGEYNRLSIGSTKEKKGYTGYFDNVMISTDPNRDLYALALLESCPRVS